MISGRDASGIHVGGAGLVEGFFEAALCISPTELVIAAAFADQGAFSSALGPAFETLTKRIVVRVVVRTASSADAVRLASCGRAVVRVNPALHAKVFVASGAEEAIALVGSHNLTAAALTANEEVGIMLRARGGDSTVAGLVKDLRALALRSFRASRDDGRRLAYRRTSRPEGAGRDQSLRGLEDGGALGLSPAFFLKK